MRAYAYRILLNAARLRESRALEFARPPLAGAAALFRSREAVEVQLRADVARRRVGEWIRTEQAERPRVALQQFAEETHEPGLVRASDIAANHISQSSRRW